MRIYSIYLYLHAYAITLQLKIWIPQDIRDLVFEGHLQDFIDGLTFRLNTLHAYIHDAACQLSWLIHAVHHPHMIYMYAKKPECEAPWVSTGA